MTNLQDGGSQISGLWLRRFWLGLPIAVGGLLAFLVLATAVLPQWLALQRDMKRRSELEALRDQVSRSRIQLQALDAADEKAQAQQAKLFEIVTGNGDLSTFMAMVDREAKLAGVQLDLFQPQAAPSGAQPTTPGARPAPGQPPAGAPPRQPGQPGQPPAADSSEIKGLRTTTILLSARGPYPALVNFLHRLELLNVLVVQSDLVLQADKAVVQGPGSPQQASQTPVLMKLQIKLYAREAPPPGAAGAPTPGQPGIVAPPPAPSRSGTSSSSAPPALPNPPPGATTPSGTPAQATPPTAAQATGNAQTANPNAPPPQSPATASPTTAPAR